MLSITYCENSSLFKFRCATVLLPDNTLYEIAYRKTKAVSFKFHHTMAAI